MKKKKQVILVTIIALVAVIALFAIAWFIMNNKNNNGVESDKELSLVYSSNGGVPYTWEYEIDDETVLTKSNEYIVKDENRDGRVGAPVYTKYVFKGLKAGETKLSFKYKSFVTGEVAKLELFNVTVNKDLSIDYTMIQSTENE